MSLPGRGNGNHDRFGGPCWVVVKSRPNFFRCAEQLWLPLISVRIMSDYTCAPGVGGGVF